ncbi:hypothetical protein BOTBODRAFT_181579 [Botryobasidium botryosum FD-172 SS1]|uniref:EF-hand domain-containing protein n=1 Tax=Botryobasidium botryosum (strain FD-172 SS1) TaxID=930990 RepID=A0A067LW07_BOTB1|nr:hypothetical protein BOTBODRAFT_181579 [Botryobasidium botryosum FD-172 SS1]
MAQSIEELQAAFNSKLFDKNEDGEVSAKELKDIMLNLGRVMTVVYRILPS